MSSAPDKAFGAKVILPVVVFVPVLAFAIDRLLKRWRWARPLARREAPARPRTWEVCAGRRGEPEIGWAHISPLTFTLPPRAGKEMLVAVVIAMPAPPHAGDADAGSAQEGDLGDPHREIGIGVARLPCPASGTRP
ncbi:hypothetical protein HWV62_35276 [Athelia sp. TMB]|nr:hypothetical protein HWV62_35276 [Athelia sp. TMB]